MFRRSLIKTSLGIAAGTIALSRPASKQSAEVLLLQSTLAGFRYYSGPIVQSSLRQGDALDVVREDFNSFDARAVALYWRGLKLGFVPRADNAVIAQLIDRGQSLHAVVSALHVDRPEWQRLEFALLMRVASAQAAKR
jgi:hypothetical protein